MTPSKLREKVITARVKWIRQMLAELRSLPVDDFDTFCSDPKNIAAAESYLRRCLEALLDIGRHILAKGFGQAVAEYKQIASELMNFEVISRDQAKNLQILAGYRNRMVHFYHEITDHELFEICSSDLGEVEHLLTAVLKWIRENPEKIDRAL